MTNYQSEAELEKELIIQLNGLGFNSVVIGDEQRLINNLRNQLEKFNKTTFSDNEFSRILNELNKGDSFAKSKILRDRMVLKRDDESDFWVRFFNTDQWCKNEYQVTNQITIKGKYENRYDVTLLINGLPLVQIELKRRGVEMKEAFNQVQRYHKHSFAGTLFDYVQIFVISNGVNTKYFSNNPKQSFEQTFFWTDKANKKITQLQDFAEVFLEKCALSEFIAEYIVLAEAPQIPMVLRPYQYYAVREIEKRVKETNKNGYIWHTTGSGKTLTSFKTSQILSCMPKVHKVLFVVDRKDLDIQTTKEFNSFSDGSVDGTNKTSNLVKQLKDSSPKGKLIVTTIQKLDRAINSERYREQFKELRDKKIVIIFDECHRGQFGKTHKAIEDYFENAQLFGFTGTPIFADNNVGGVTTADVFQERLHDYTITNAIADNNVLGFAVEYVGKYSKKSSDVVDSDIATDTMVPGIDTKEVLEDPKRISKVVDYVLEDWKRKTKKGKYNALLAVSSIDFLKQYYAYLNSKKPGGFSVATIFTYQANEDQSDDLLDVDLFSVLDEKGNLHSRDFLENCIVDYNEQFGVNFSTDRFYEYYKDVQKRVKNKEVDLILVVNMFLTGFDSKYLNTLYVDKNLRYHGLIQAYSRTNRLHNADKPHGNIVVFRNLKDATDKALQLFGDEGAQEIVIKKPYEEQKQNFEAKLAVLKGIAPEVEYVNFFQGETQKAQFVTAFRNLLRIKSSLETYAGFNFDELGITEQEFYNYQSKYLDLYQERKKVQEEKVSILDEIDFELELTIRDIVDFDYIIRLIAGIRDVKSPLNKAKKKEQILALFDRDLQLRKKRELIEKFIEENLPSVGEGEDIEEAFQKFWTKERSIQITELSSKENIPESELTNLITEYLYTQKLPKDQEIADKLPEQPSILERKPLLERIRAAIIDIVDIFEW